MNKEMTNKSQMFSSLLKCNLLRQIRPQPFVGLHISVQMALGLPKNQSAPRIPYDMRFWVQIAFWLDPVQGAV